MTERDGIFQAGKSAQTLAVEMGAVTAAKIKPASAIVNEVCQVLNTILFLLTKYLYYCPRRVLAQTAETRGGTLEIPAQRQNYVAVAKEILIFFVNKARKGLPKPCWRSDKHTAIK